MADGEWVRVPVGIEAHRWVTRQGCRMVLVVVHTLVSGQRLLDVIGQIESDPRIQVVFTQAPDVFTLGVAEWLRGVGAFVIPWQQAVHEHFDLAIAAAFGGLAEVHAPLLVLPHGAGFGKFVPRSHGSGAQAPRQVYGLDAHRLVRDGRVLVDMLALSTDAQLAVLADQCPEALPAALVVGDPCYDRLMASVAFRKHYREILGLSGQQELVVVASTWGPASLFGRQGDVLPRLVQRLPRDRYRVAVMLHPAVWFGHGPRQLRAWLSECTQAGLVIVPPDVDWRAAVIAADYVIGDHGSVPVYAACAEVPVLGADAPGVNAVREEMAPDCANALVSATAPHLDLAGPVEDQLQHARQAWTPRAYQRVAAAVTSCPGRASALLRSQMYRMLGLDERGRHRRLEPVPPVTGDTR